MRTKSTLTKADAVVSVLILLVLLASLGAVGSSGRRRAKETVCLANLRHWGTVFQGLAQENDGRFFTPFHAYGYWWPMQLEPELQDWKKNRTWLCPEADEPSYDELGSAKGSGPFYAWGIYKDPMTVENGICGSYGINGYVIPTPANRFEAGVYEGGVSTDNGWLTPNVSDTDKIPLFIDALRFDLWPLESHAPAASEFAAWSSNHMARCAINRHNGAVNSLFLDFSARKVGLKELWTLKWHRSFNTAGPWTSAGGVQPDDWPEWMRDFKDY